MTVINIDLINDFCARHSDARIACQRWYNLLKETDCRSWHEMKQMFNSVDNVGNDHYVFNIKGNRYRLIAVIHFQLQTVCIKRVCTHEEYDNIKPKPDAISLL